MSLNENTILLIQEAVDSYIIELNKKLDELEDKETANKDKAIKLRCNIRELQETANYLEDKKRASKDVEIEAKQLREAVESLLIQIDNNHLEQFEAQNVSYELQKTALKIIEYIGLTLPAFRYIDLYKNK